MIPDLPIIKNSPLRFGFSESHYNPRILFTRLVSGALEDVNDPNFWESAFQYNATVVHEHVHWLQHHGTSLGTFLDALRFSQQQTTLGWFRTFLPDKVRDLLVRRSQRIERVLILDPNRQYPQFSDKPDEEQINLFRQIWYDHQWLHTLFEDSRVCDDIGKPPGQAVGEVIGDVMLTLCTDGNFECDTKEIITSNPFEARSWFSFEDSSIAFVRLGGMRITTRMIMEAAATIAELQILSSGAWNDFLAEDRTEKAIAKRMEAVIEGDYGVPIRSVLYVLGGDITDIPSILPTVSVLCFLALNPPLPPYVMKPRDDGAPWRWEDVYPPFRFVKLCGVLSEVGLINDCRDHSTIDSYITRLTESSGIPTALGIPYPRFIPDPKVPDFENPKQSYSESVEASFHDYVFWVQSKVSHFRGEALPLLVSFGDCITGDLARQYVEEIVVKDEVPYSRCPLLWMKSNKTGYSCPKEFGNWLIRSLVFHHLLFDVVVGEGEFYLDDFPPDIRESGFIKNIDKSMLKNLAEVRNR